MKTKSQSEEKTLDPQNWDETRATMHQMVDDAVDYMSGVRERPIWQEIPEDILETFQLPVPRNGEGLGSVYSEFKTHILPYPMGNTHPRFWAWYMGNGTTTGVMGDFWASVINCNMGGGNHAGHKIEEQVVDWLKEIVGFPKDAGGLLVSGGSMANYTALAVARNVKLNYDVRKEGIRPNIATKVRVYASSEIHSCNQKALELLGLGSDSLVKIKVNQDFTINLEALKEKIKEDRANGLLPICVIGTSGTVNTGAIDNLEELSKICIEEDLWFHIDGAIGAIAILSEKVKPLLKGIDLADSVAIDLHKWMHMPFEAACILIKDKQSHKDTFSLIPEYLEKNTRGVASGDNWFSEYGLQLSRRFRALKIWMSLKVHGADLFGEMISKNVEQAHYLEGLVNKSAELEMVAPVGLDIVCFRFNPGNLNLDELNSINKEIKLQLEENAIAMPGYTTINGIYCIRVAICNHRSTFADFDDLVFHIKRLGRELNQKEFFNSLN
ncbi:Glutamate or tyrosine decarboxylase [Flavobacteriaceae bacterium MAR_2010_188]|nr:Glutamate or tyrosine decarboxylase [Flavobacteriaceae bacterium MAR_2010_188]